MPELDILFDEMLSAGASDLHLHEGQKPKLRLHGQIKTLEQYPQLSRQTLQTALGELCRREYWDKFQNKHDLDFAYAYEDKARFRANYKMHYHGLGAVFRTIPSRILTLEELGTPRAIKAFADFNAGLCLVTGPTGSGKSTTLAALIDFINTTQRRTILTIEEPIEFVHSSKNSSVSQREVGIDCHSFYEGLSGALRADMEVILVGEMRDLETIRLAVNAAETGLLVFGTLHTNSAIKTIDRIIDVFPSDEQSAVRESLANALRAVCAQLLLRKASGSGRVAVHEIMIQTRAVSNLIREAKTNQLAQAIMSGKNIGMQLMDDAIEAVLNAGLVNGLDAYMKAHDKERFSQYAPLGG